MLNLHDFYTALLSGVLEKHNEKEYWWEYKYGPITVEIADIAQQKYIVRRYYKNGNKYWKTEYQNGLLHGKYIGWYENGNKWRKREYQNGELHGKSIRWYENGNKDWEEEYQNGKQIK